jgi:hypothetical protein
MKKEFSCSINFLTNFEASGLNTDNEKPIHETALL